MLIETKNNDRLVLTAKKIGNSTCVHLPKEWLGKQVIVLCEDNILQIHLNTGEEPCNTSNSKTQTE